MEPQTVTTLSLRKKLLWIGLFAVTMGYFEAAIVEYLRELYYPEGFKFPLKEIPQRILIIELFRELASLLMILAVSVIAGKLFIDRFAGFCFIFGVWDILYYVFLYVFEGWPPSLLTDDILFLLPAPWVGPVWAPIGVSIGLILSAILIWHKLDQGAVVKPTKVEWIIEITAGLIIISSFLYSVPQTIASQPLPPYPWYLWVVGMTIGLITFFRFISRA